MEITDLLLRLPYPIAAVYATLDNPQASPQSQMQALHTTVYQVMRTIGLTLMGQYFAQDIPPTASKETVRKFNEAILHVSFPYFSEWKNLLGAIKTHGPALRLDFFPEFPEALRKASSQKVLRPQQYNLDKESNLEVTLLDAFQGLRNFWAHANDFDNAECAFAVETYRPWLDDLLTIFGFLADYDLLVLRSSLDPLGDTTLVEVLRGPQPAPPQEMEVEEALRASFEASPVIMRSPLGRYQALFPFFHGHIEGELLRYYDGHYLSENPYRRTIYYLGNHIRISVQDDEIPSRLLPSAHTTAAASLLLEMLRSRQVPWQMRREDVAPWTLLHTANDFSQRTLSDQIEVKKYLPSCYLDRPVLSEPLRQFLTTKQTPFRAFLLSGSAGCGKTALTCDLTQWLLNDHPDHAVFYLRGDGILCEGFGEVPGSNLLLLNLLHKMGVHHTDFPTFGAFFSYLAGKVPKDQKNDRRFVILLDALNEAQKPALLLDEALEMISAARPYPWLRIVLTAREEFLDVWRGRRGNAQASPFYPVLSLFVPPPDDPQHPRQPEDLPAWRLSSFTLAEAEIVYSRFQVAKARGEAVKACRTPWDRISPAIRETILTLPLHVDLWMSAFDGREAPVITGAVGLFAAYLNDLYARFPKFRENMALILDHILQEGRMELTDGDAHDIRAAWEEPLTDFQRGNLFSPVELACLAGVMQKRVTEEGGGYRIPFQALAEYMLYRRLGDRPRSGEDEAAYWTRLSQVTPVFTEYAGAFAFLLREWTAQGRLSLVGPLLEASAPWLDEVVLAFLMEQAQTGYVPGQGSEAGNAAAKALAESGGRRCAGNLFDAGHRVGNSKFAEVGIAYLQAANQLNEVLWVANPEDVGIGVGLGGVLTSLGDLFQRSGRPTEAEAAYARAGDIQKAQWMALSLPEALEEAEPADKGDDRLALSPSQLLISVGIAHSLNSQGDLLRKRGRPAEAEVAYTQAIDILESLWEADEADDGIGGELVRALASQGDLFQRNGRPAEAEVAYTRALGISEALWAGNPQDVSLGSGLAGLLLSRGVLFHHTGRPVEAEATYTRAVEMNEALWSVRPEDVRIGGRLAMTLNNLGGLLAVGGRQAEAEVAFTRAIDVYEALWLANPQDVEIKIGYANTLAAVGRTDEAEPLINEVLAQMPRHPLANEIKQRYFSESEESEPSNSGLATILAVGGIALGALFAVLKHRGKKDE